jgi:hypothetical protein
MSFNEIESFCRNEIECSVVMKLNRSVVMKFLLEKRFYIPIFKYLKSTYINPKGNKKKWWFCLSHILQQFGCISFYCLSVSVLFSVKEYFQKLKAKQCYLKIKYQINQFPSIQAKEQKSIFSQINQLSLIKIIFKYFKKIFVTLGLAVLIYFLVLKHQAFPTEFYLSVYSLKNTNNSTLNQKFMKLNMKRKHC